MPYTVTIIGGGNSGHVCASLIHGNTDGEFVVQLLTTRKDIWSDEPIVRFPDGSTQTGKLTRVSTDPSKVIPNADLVLWTGPVNATKSVFEMIAKHVDVKKTVIGTIFGQGLMHVLASRIFGSDAKFFALRNIPWLCRTITPGQQCEVVGPKTSIEVALMGGLDSDWVNSHLYPLFKIPSGEPRIHVLPDFAPIVFNPANQIIHPAVYFAHFRKWIKGGLLGREDEPNEWLYRDMSELAGQILATLDEELQRVKDEFSERTNSKSCSAVLTLHDRLIQQYGDQIKDKSTMAKMVGTNSAYAMAKTPMIRTPEGVAPNPTHRVVVDDIGYGLCVLVDIAERLHVAVPMMKFMIEWHQDMMGKEYLKNGKICGKDISELVLLRPEDPITVVANIL